MDAILLSLLGITGSLAIALLIYVFTLNREVHRIENKHDAAIGEIKDVKEELARIAASLAEAQESKAKETDEKVKRCQEQIKNLHVDVSGIHRDYQLKPETAAKIAAIQAFLPKK